MTEWGEGGGGQKSTEFVIYECPLANDVSVKTCLYNNSAANVKLIIEILSPKILAKYLLN